MNKDPNRILVAGSILTAFVASLCCVGPLIFAVGGLGVFGAATLFGELRFYFLIAAAVLLAAGFYFTYLPRKIVCEDGTCMTTKAGRTSKIFLWLTAGLVVLFALLPYFTAYLLTKAPESQILSTPDQEMSMQSITFRVEGMTCGGCVANVEAALKEVPGVTIATADLKTETAKVVFDPSKADRKRIADAVKKSGYAPVLRKK